MKNHYSEPNFADICCTFTHQEILELQDKFLTPGFNLITVRNRAEGQKIVLDALASMPHLHNIAVLSHENLALPKERYSDLYSLLISDNALSTYEALTFFCLESFNFDLLWIEALPKLYSTAWFAVFEQVIIDLGIPHKIPIVVVQTQQDDNDDYVKTY